MKIYIADNFNDYTDKYINNRASIDYSNYLLIPVRLQELKNGALSIGRITLNGLTSDIEFKRFSYVSFHIDNKVYAYCLAKDEVSKVLTGYYKHEITLVEQTKLLERYVVDNCTFTRSLIKKQSEYPQILDFTYQVNGQTTIFGYYSNTNTQYAFTNENDISLPNMQDLLTTHNTQRPQDNLSVDNLLNAKYITPNGTEASFSNVYSPVLLESNLQLGYYTIIYNGYNIDGSENTIPVIVEFNILVLPPDNLYPEYNVKNAVERLIKLSDTLFSQETPKFTFNNDNDWQLKTIPNLSFENKTLRECLDTIALIYNCLSVLNGNEIKFVPINEIKNSSMPSNFIGYNKIKDIEEYATKLDSQVSNLINTDFTKIEPFASGYKTVRASGTIRIGVGSDATSIIETESPIYELKKLEIGLFNNITIGDITEFVYEKTDYDVLSSYARGTKSKGFAIYYEIYQKNIKGLDFKLDNVISPIFENIAIFNILNLKLNSASHINSEKVLEIPYTIEYLTLENKRVQAHKQLVSTDNESVLLYNQSANLVNSSSYGEDLRNKLERIGNIQEQKTYFAKDLTNITDLGNINNQNFVYKKDFELYNNYIKYTLSYSKNYNLIQKFVAIENEKRFYEVAISGVKDRQIIVNDFMCISDEAPTNQTTDTIVTSDFINYFVNKCGSVSNSAIQTGSYLSVVTNDYKSNNSEIETRFYLPVETYVMGNSVIYSIKFNDNYSIGNISESGTSTYRIQKYARYVDYFGKVAKLGFRTFKSKSIGQTKNDELSTGNILPQTSGIDINGNAYTISGTETDSYINTNGFVNIDKDSKERLTINYQLNFVKKNDNFVINGNIFKSLNENIKLYLCPDYIDKLENLLPSNAVEIEEFTGLNNPFNRVNNIITFNYSGLNFDTNKNNKKSWVLASGNNIVLGKNTNVGNLSGITFYIQFKHKKENL